MRSLTRSQTIDTHTYRSGSVWDMTFSRDPQQTYIYAANGVDQKINILLRSSLEVLTSSAMADVVRDSSLASTISRPISKGNLYATETCCPLQSS